MQRLQASCPSCSRILIRLEQVSIIRNGKTLLDNVDWVIDEGDSWVITGSNGSGKTLLVQAIRRQIPTSQGNVIFPDEGLVRDIALVSFELQYSVLESENNRDEGRAYSGDFGTRTTLRDLIATGCKGSHRDDRRERELLQLLGLSTLFDAQIMTLSNGEMRKALIARALFTSPKILILDEPFDGLDVRSRTHLSEIIGNMINAGMQCILITHHIDDVPQSFQKIISLDHGRIDYKGSITDFKTIDSKINNRPLGVSVSSIDQGMNGCRVERTNIVRMLGVEVRYGDKVIFDRFDWTVWSDENWAITGPNGAGKSTLLKLISADHPQAYSNDIWLFGMKRGSGESIWDIKKRIGVLSPELQISYRKNLKTIDVVMSGFFDSIGLYHRTTDDQLEKAMEWLAFFSIDGIAQEPFQRLSYGEKRLVLLARALVKSPELLILDEPCQGLDVENRCRLIETVHSVARRTGTPFLFVTHRIDELPANMTHVMELKPGVRDDRGSSCIIRKIGDCVDTPTRNKPFIGS